MTEKETTKVNQVTSSNIEQNEKKEVVKGDLNKENQVINMLFLSLTIVCFIGTFFMIFTYDDYWATKILYKPEGYKTPKLSDFLTIGYLLPIYALIKIIFNKYTQDLMYYFVSKKYKNPYDEENFKMGKVFKKKLATALFKIFYYTGSVIAAYFIMKDLDFLPWQLFGKGDMMNIVSTEKGEHAYLFWNKPMYFKEYYFSGLAFVLTDLIWLLFVYEMQSDFYLMLLHHSITISLIVFSYLSNLDNFGAIVFFLHDITDIFVYWVRIAINTDYNDVIKLTPCVLLLLSYIFYRIHLFGKLIYISMFLSPEYNKFNVTLSLFKCILMIAHIYWVFQIVKRFYHYSFVDVGTVNKKSK